MDSKPAAPSESVRFLMALLGAVRELTGRRPPPTWVHVEKVQTKLSTANTDAVDAGIRVAVARGWLRAHGEPATSVTMTAQGIKLIEPTPSK